jgi:hypothetical protein
MSLKADERSAIFDLVRFIEELKKKSGFVFIADKLEATQKEILEFCNRESA